MLKPNRIVYINAISSANGCIYIITILKDGDRWEHQEENSLKSLELQPGPR
jgi:hypothetical protein